MNTAKRKKLKLPMDEVNTGLKIERVPNAAVAVASVLARWFDNIIRGRNLIPNLKGQYVFAVLRRQFEYNTGSYTPSQSLKKYLLDYGYKLKLQGPEVIVTKFR